MRVLYLSVAAFLLFPVLLSAQPKKMAAEILAMEKSGNYVHVKADGDDEAQAEQNGRKKLIQLIKLQYGVPEQAGMKKSADDLESFRPVSRAGNEIVTEKFIWTEKKKTFAVVYAKKSVARTIAIAAATSAFRDDEEFVFGEFTDRDPNRSSNEAKANLIAQIQQRVETERSVVTEENRSTNTAGKTITTDSEAFKSQSKVLSRMTLQGLKTIALNMDGDIYTFAFITKPDIEKSFEPVKTKILSLTSEGETFFAENRPSQALSSFYRAYILCDAYFSTLSFTFKDGTTARDVRAALENRINSIIDSVQLVPKPAYELDERLVVVPFHATFRNAPLPGLLYILEYGAYTAAGPVATSGTLIELSNFLPDGRITTLHPKLLIDIRDFLQTDETLAELAPSRILSIQKELAVDFSNLYKFNIRGDFSDYSVKFSIEPRLNDMIRLVKWEFGDGASDTRANLTVTHTYDEKGTYKIRASVNGDPLLVEERFVDFAAKRIRMTPPPACNACEKVETPVQQVITVNSVFDELNGIQTTAGLMSTLKTMKERGKVTFGRQSDLSNAEGAMVLVVDQQRVVDKLVFSGNRYFQVSSNEPVTNLAERYKDKRLIWVKQL